MISYLENFEEIWGPFRLFHYITFRAGIALILSMVIGFAIGPWVIGRLKALKLEQSLRTEKEVGDLAKLHAKKKDTPTMGGVLIYLCIVPSVILCARLNVFVVVGLIVYTGLSVIGFLDDYLKISKRNSKGLASHWKLGGQGALTLISLWILLGNPDTHMQMSELWVPFIKFPIMEQMPLLFIVVFFFFVVAGTSNAINLTDGIDGLAIGCVIPVVMVYSIMAYISGHAILASYLFKGFIPGTGELSIVCASVMGAALVFLWYNAHPAEVFMGDTGSLGLGGLIGAMAFMVHEAFTLVIVGGVFVIEAMSVILQIGSYKLRGKRIFRMAPIHHHFELKNWHENKVVIRFWIVSLMFALIGLSTLKLR